MNYAKYRHCQIEFIEIAKKKLKITKIELTGGHIGIMLNIDIAQIELTGGHIGITLIIIEIADLTGGHYQIGIKPAAILELC